MRPTIHQLIAERARLQPDARAVVHEDVALSYGELDARANRLAHYLVKRGVGPDVIVGVHMDRSSLLVVAMLAVLKAGGAYVPLDPNYPSDRNAFMLSDSGARVVLTDLPFEVPFDGTCISVRSSEIEQQSSAAVDAHVDAENLAYIIYTSGSTGRPKGVMIPHDQVVRLMGSTQAWFRFDENDVWTFFHSYAFDFSVWEIWGALISGGSVVVVPDAVRRSPDDLLSLLSRERVTVLNQIPSAFRHLIGSATRTLTTVPLSLRYVIFGGEALDLRALVPWFERYSAQPTLVNMYGITETTVHVTYRVIDPPESVSRAGSPIGVPLPDLELYVLDPLLRRVEVGGEGELYVGGKGLARGYHARPSLTAERFVPDPFSGRAGDRLYKTGDVARRTSDGFEYVGRNDAQVKIRGHRIETGEIASVLATHPAVREAAVVVTDVGDGDRRLVAYVVFRATASTDDLTAYLASRLPEYMLPPMFVPLNALPITPSGKVDVGALPAPDWTSRVDEMGQMPRTPDEAVLARLWCEVLRIKSVGVRDDFFELGGHSLLAIKLVAKARVALAVEVTIGQLFAFPTIEQLAVEISRMRAQSDLPDEIPRVARDALIPASSAQKRIWFVERTLGVNSTRPFNSTFALEMHGEVDADALARGLSALIERHEILRTNFKIVGKQLVQVIGAPFPLSLEPTRLEPLAGPARAIQLDELATDLARPPFDLARDRLLRARLVTFGERDFVLLLAMHHAIYDGAAVRVMMDELATLYDGRSLPELSLQYADIAAWQHTALSSAETERQLAFWRRCLDGAQLVQIPPDVPPSAEISDAGGIVPVRLSSSQTESVRRVVRAENATPFMGMVAAVAGVIATRTGVDDVIIGTIVTDRDHASVERSLGVLLNVLALRIDVGGDPSFRELIARVRTVVGDAMANRDVPYETVVTSATTRASSRHGLFQFVVSLEDASSALASPSGQVWELSLRHTGSVNGDLPLELVDDGVTLSGTLSYRSTSFSPAGAQDLATQICGTLVRGAISPHLPLSMLASEVG